MLNQMIKFKYPSKCGKVRFNDLYSLIILNIDNFCFRFIINTIDYAQKFLFSNFIFNSYLNQFLWYFLYI